MADAKELEVATNGIRFFNVKTKEVRLADTEPLISAFYNSSDQSPNAHLGQDFGWRLAPELVVRIKKMKQDPAMVEQVARRFNIPQENVGDTDYLWYIALEQIRDSEIKDSDEDFTQEYEDEIRALEKESNGPSDEEKEQAKAEAQAKKDAAKKAEQDAADKKAQEEAEAKAKSDAEQKKADEDKKLAESKAKEDNKSGNIKP